jgi:hypothetical protein
VDTVTDFVSGTDKLAISQSVFGIGSDLVLDNAVVKAGPRLRCRCRTGDPDAERGHPERQHGGSGHRLGQQRLRRRRQVLFSLHSGSTTTVYLFTSNGADAAVSAGELTQTLTGTATVADFQLV